MSAWYIETWVNAPLPVTSPTAQVLGTPEHAEVVVDGQGARVLVHADRRRRRASRRSLRARSRRAAARRRTGSPVPRARWRSRAVVGDRLDRRMGHGLDPLARRTPSVSSSLASGSSSDHEPGPASRTVTRAPNRREHLGELDADRPAADDRERRRAPRSPRSPRGSSRTASRRAPRSGGSDAPRADADDDGACAPRARVSPTTTRPGPSSRPHPGRAVRLWPRTARRRPCRPSRPSPPSGSASRPGAQSARDGRRIPAMPSTRRASGEQVGGADHHLRGHAPPVGALAADELRLDPDHVEARLGEPPRERPRTWAEPDHDDVCLLGHGCLLGAPSTRRHGGGAARGPAPPPLWPTRR